MSQISRRKFLTTTTTGLAGGFFLGTAPLRPLLRSSLDKLDIGIVGCANRAAANIGGVAGENIVALCDVDENYLGQAGERFPKATRYADFRDMIGREKLDAVVVSTADHTHAPATLLALAHGADVYCEKPLTHTVHEARQVAKLARQQKAVTQMGTQIHAGANYRRVVELIQGGVLGQVHQAYSWVGKAWGGGERPTEVQPVPAHFHHDLWLGPAPARPYHDLYHPAQWRRFWDFGGGTLGDMGCHHLDLPFWALALRHPVAVEADGPAVHAETAPPQMHARWQFPQRITPDGRSLDAVDLHWSDGGMRPPQFLDPDLAMPQWGDGTLFVGEKGMLLCDYGRHVLLPADKWEGFEAPAPTIPNSIGHYQEWLQAIRERGKTTCNFGYSGALTETVLLGNVAYRAGEAFDWDAGNLKASSERAQRFIRREYRKDWVL